MSLKIVKSHKQPFPYVPFTYKTTPFTQVMMNDPNPSRFFRIPVLVLLLFFMVANQVDAQPGKNGPLTVTTANTVVNCYSAVTANIAPGTNTVTVNSTGELCGITCGDLIMVYQAQGANIDVTNTTAYGTITNMNQSGFYEFNYVVSVAGSTITVQNNWANTYTAVGAGYAQVVKVPQYTNLTINAGASIVASPWQQVATRRFGGVVAIHATGTITVNGAIQTNAQGFRGGLTENNTSAAGGGIVTDFVSNSSSASAEKGESIAGFQTDYDGMGGRYGRGAPANGGGGGNGHNAGGGGGSNANNGVAYTGHGNMCTACAGSAAWNLDPYFISFGVLSVSSGGGRGGYSYGASNQNALVVAPSAASWGGDQRDPVGGLGGKPLNATAASRVFFGGGGGAGDMNNNSGLRAGNGGGLVYLVANSVIGVGNIRSNGEDGLNQAALGTACANDAPAGGGGGGTVIIKSGAIANSLTLSATGGKGSDQNNLPTESEGPGGGGGGGFIAISTGAPTINVAGGANGITLSGSLTEFQPNGATSGGSGQSTGIATGFITYVSPIPVIVTNSNSPVCTGQTITFTTTTLAGATYAWSGPVAFASALQNPTRPGATMPMAGVYQVIYTSAGGCKDTNFTTVVVHPTPVVNGTFINPLCNGDCNGSATVNITTGGTPSYTFAWSNGATTQTASSLCAGPYSVVVTDNFNCTASANVVLTNPPALSATNTVVQPSCNGSCNGSITINPTGGTAPYNYSVDGSAFQPGNVFNSLCAGAHVVTVRDNNNCLFTYNTNITQPPVLTVALVSNTPSTCGSVNGILVFSAAGGTPGYTFALDGGAPQVSGTFSPLASGSHTVVVTDSKTCTATLTVTVNNSGAPTASILSQQNVTCFGGANGSVLIGAVGGTPSFLYRKVPGAFGATNSFGSLTVGTYTFEVQDANGCISSVVVNITSPPQLTYTSVAVAASCNGVCDGQITVNPAGGTPSYMYSSNNGLSFTAANPLTGLCAGNIFLVVKDANGCLANSIVVITQPTPVNAAFVNTDPFCDGVCNGQIVANAAGGSPGYQYSLNGGPLQPSNTFTSVCSGAQTVVVQDSHGCQFTSVQNLTAPPGITINEISNNPSSCGFNSGSFEVQATGDHPAFQYSVNGGPNQPSGFYGSLVAGAYNVVVTDALGCQENTFIGINDIEMSGVLNSVTNVTCFGGSDGAVSTVATGGVAPIQYDLDLLGSFEFDGDFTGLTAGPHIVLMVDNGFCIYTIPFDITEPDPITFNRTLTNISCFNGTTGQIQFNTVAGGNGIYEYSIDGGATFQASPNFAGLIAGIYPLVVRDQFGCTGTGTATLTQPTQITFGLNVVDLTCFNNGTGFVQIVAAGGTPAYNYSFNGSPFGPGFTFFGLAANTYNFTIRDNNLCTISSTVTVGQPAPLAAVYATVAPLCNGSCDGEISIAPSGGTSPYVYSSDGGLSYGISSTITGLCAGTHNIVVKDSNSCQIGTSLNILNPPALVFGTNVNNATCGADNGQIQFTGVAGGTGVYEYALDGGAPQPSNTFPGLEPGDYTVTLFDDNGCSVDGLVTVANEGSPTLIAAIGTAALCNGSCDGTIAVNATGGTGLLQYSINGGALQTSPNFAGLCAGNYLVLVQDANGCGDTANVTLTDPAVLAMNTVVVNLQCFQDNTGSVTVNVVGGTLPFLYSFDGGATSGASNSFNFIGAGTYNIEVTDDHGCVVTGSGTVTEPAPITLTSMAITNATCNAVCDGEVTVTPAGGTVAGAYDYLWTPAAIGSINSPTADDLCAGTYSVIIRDDNNCILDTSFTITEPLPFLVTDIDWTDVLCNGDCNGTATIIAATGVQFSLNGGPPQASNNFTGLCPGVYPIQVVDGIGCIANSVVVIGEPAVLNILSTPDTLICTNDTTPLYGLGIGGVVPYTYHWSNTPANIPNQEVSPAVATTFTVFVTDANGCTSPTNNINITIRPLLTATVSNDTTICEGSPLTFTAAGANGLPYYSYNWTPTDTLPTYSVTPTAPGSYTVIVSDQCADTETLTVNVAFHPQPLVSFVVDETAGCSPLTVQFTNTTPAGMIGASPCEWYNGDDLIGTNCNSISYTFTEAGCYDISLTVTSPQGCAENFEQSDMVCVYPDPIAGFTTTSDPSPPTILQSNITYINNTINGQSYIWDFAGVGSSTAVNPTFNFEPDSAGSYQVCLFATSPDGCLDTICQPVFIQDVLLLYVPNAFTPDADGVNDIFYPVLTGADKELYNFMIFDRWGELIFQTEEIGRGWDGTFKNVKCKEDVYVWKIKFRDKIEGVNKEYYGHVTLLR